jgi:DNA polymerase-3 subunit delta'
MAAAWLCSAATPQGACGECESCRWWGSGAHPDLHLLQPLEQDESSDTLTRHEIKVEALRVLSQWAVSTAHRGRKAVVIEPAETMNGSAANALLKLLEEPPRAVRFFLSASDPRRLPATVVSRCVQLYAPPAPPEAAKAWLLAQNVPTAQLETMLAQAGGAPFLALQHADEAIQAARRPFLDAIAAPNALSVLVLGDVLDGISRPARRTALQQRLHWLACWVHDLQVTKVGGSARFNPDYNTVLCRLADSLPTVGGFRYYANLIGRLQTIQHPLNPRLVLEDALMDYKRLMTVGT